MFSIIIFATGLGLGIVAAIMAIEQNRFEKNLWGEK